MNLIRFNPYAEVTSLQDRINRLFEEVSTPRGEAREAAPRLWGPAVDIAENANEVTVTMDIPGVDLGAIDVQLTGDNLTVRGERRVARPEGQNMVHLERPQGAFQRSFTIGVAVQPDRVSASYRDGVLMITLPKAETVKPRKVQIQPATEDGRPAEPAGAR